MGKLLKVLAKEKADKGFDILRDIYERRKANSMNPDELLNREIEVHELLFDEKKLPLNPLLPSSYRPLKSKGLIYTDGDIIRIREAYFRYVVNDADISLSGQVYKSKNGLYRRRPPDDFEIHYYSEAVQRYNYLKYLLNQFTEHNEQKTALDPARELSIPQIALIHAYKGIQITRENDSEIAAKYGYTAPKSGEGLFQDYEKYYKSSKRTAITKPFTQIKMENKITLFESILNYLTGKAKQRAIDEIQILKTHYETEFL